MSSEGTPINSENLRDDCLPPGSERTSPGMRSPSAGNRENATLEEANCPPDIKPVISMADPDTKNQRADVIIESTNQEYFCEPRKKRRRQYKTLGRRFINPMTVKGCLLYNANAMDTLDGNDASSVKSDKDYFLSVFNFPENWKDNQIKDFVEKEFELVNNIEMLLDKDDNFIGTIQLSFNNPEQCKLAKAKFMGQEVEGRRLEAYDSEDESDSDVESTEPQAKRKNKGQWRPDMDIWEKDPKGMYGLKPEYLKVMGIKPPIDRWVHVTNFRTSKAELREVMELAGEVVVCSVVAGQQMYAKVMYSHPLEAVQAVSMLHNRQYHGTALKVVMDTCPASSCYLLPNGLLNVGPGLGSNGSPLRDIVRHYERFVKGFHSSINTALFHEPDEKTPSSVTIDANFRKLKQEIPQAETNKFVPRNVPQSNQSQPVMKWEPPPMSISNQVRPSVPQFNYRPQSNPVVFGPQFPGQTPGSRNGPSGPMPGPIRGPNSPISGPSRPCQQRPMGLVGPMSGLPTRHVGPTGSMIDGPRPSGPGRPMPGAIDPVRGPTGPMPDLTRPMNAAPSPVDHVTVELGNLPLNTTFPLLSEKMGLCGPVLSLQLTGPGRALVQYSHRTYADRCYQQYNNACVLGNIIKVRFV